MPQKKNFVLGFTIAAVAMLVLVSAAGAGELPWLGSETCAGCHYPYYNDFRVSGHPYKLVPADEAMIRPIPLPQISCSGAQCEWDDITYVIGGYKWKSRYMGTDGYIITENGMNQFNYATGAWSNYHTDEMKPYDCGSCHTTGWIADADAETDMDLGDNQDGLPGIWGTWEFPGIQCEGCHGPSAGGTPFTPEHGFSDTSSAACGTCHIRGDELTIPASGGFIRHHEQWNELLASPHKDMDCTLCHDPHKKSEYSIRVTCEHGLCHPDQTASYAGTKMEVAGVECWDCHMPYATKSAVAFSPYKGDVRTHIFTIDPSDSATMFTPDGSFVELDAEGQAAVTIDFACRGCHNTNAFGAMERVATGFHDHPRRPKSLDRESADLGRSKRR